MTADPRRRRAEQIRDQVLVDLAAGPLWFGELYELISRRVVGVLHDSQLVHALDVLRKAGKVRFVSAGWELVP